MGIIILAEDPHLQRKVAIKLLQPASLLGSDANKDRRRLLREARAMARLSHENVANVYEVGTSGGSVFVAMEYLAGGTLRQWLEADSRPWREVVRMFLGAGRGLAAAHSAGFVHRDFKPDNVLLGDDGKVRVCDFGLAASLRGGADSELGSAEGAETSEDLRPDLTVTGLAMGTPAYMSPEQHLRSAVDARSDQFAFCVALYEGLYGDRPFAGETAAVICSNAMAGDVRAEPSGARIPNWLRRILLRGLAADPDQRFDSMADLLRALEFGLRARPRRRIAAAAVAVALLGAAGAIAFASGAGERSAVCDAQGALARVWNPSRADAIAEAFRASGRGDAEEAATRVTSLLDDFGRSWVVLREAACPTAAGAGEAGTPAMKLRVHCLDRGLDQLGALVDGLVAADDQLLQSNAVENSVVAAYSLLPKLTDCDDPQNMALRLGMPLDPGERAEVRGLYAELSAARVRDELRDTRGAEAIARTVIGRARDHYPAVHAEAALQLASALAQQQQYDAAEASAQEAIQLAAASKRDDVAAQAWIELLVMVGHGRADPVRAREWFSAARAAVIRAGDGAELQGRLARAVGVVLARGGEYREAQTEFGRALQLLEQALGASDVSVGSVQNDLSVVSRKLSQMDDAEAYARRSLAVFESVIGEHGAEVANARVSLGYALLGSGKVEQAYAEFARSLALRESVLGAEDPRLADLLLPLASALGAQGRTAERRRALARAVALYAAAYPPDHPDLAAARVNYATALQEENELEAATAQLNLALEVLRATLGPEHPRTAIALTNLGDIALLQGRYEEAREYFLTALGPLERTYGPAHPACGHIYSRLAEAELELEHPHAAIDPLEKVLEMRRGGELEVALAQFALARALRGARRQPERALRLAHEARRALAALERSPESVRALDELDTWLRQARR